MAGSIGNQNAMNAMKHGLRSGERHGLTIGRCPAGSQYVGRLLSQFRRGLEQAVRQTKGTISRADAGLIDRAVHWHRHSLLARRWLREAGDTLSPEERLRFSYAVADACDRREASIGRLGIGDTGELPPSDPLGMLLAGGHQGPSEAVQGEDDPEHQSEDEDARDGRIEAGAGDSEENYR